MGEPTLQDLAAELQALRTRGQQIVVIPKERTVKKFWGATESLRQFEEEVKELWASGPDKTNAEKVSAILNNISDSVRDELECHPKASRENPDSLLKIVKDTYGEKRTLSALLGEFYNTSQRPRESVREYSHSLNKMFRDVQRRQVADEDQALEDKVLRDHFVAKLHSADLRRRLREKVHEKPASTFLEIRDEAVRWTADDEGSEEVRAAPAQTDLLASTMEKMLDKMQRMEEQLQALQNAPRQQQRFTPRGPRFTSDGQIICYGCNKPGHIRMNCPGNARPQ